MQPGASELSRVVPLGERRDLFGTEDPSDGGVNQAMASAAVTSRATRCDHGRPSARAAYNGGFEFGFSYSEAYTSIHAKCAKVRPVCVKRLTATLYPLD